MRRIGAPLLALALWIVPVTLVFPASAQESQQEKKEEKKGGLGEPNMGWQWANFVVLAALFAYLAVKKGGPYFDSRAAEIRKGIDEAERIKADSAGKIAEINNKLGRLDNEIASLRESAQLERRSAEQRLKDETQRAIERVRVHAEAEIETASKAERIALQRYVTQLAMELAETKVRAHMNPQTEDSLVRAFVNGLGAIPGRVQTH